MRIGDNVSVIDENLNGTVRAVQGNKITFEDEFGFSYTYPKEKLIVRNSSWTSEVDKAVTKSDDRNVSKKHRHNFYKLDLHIDKLTRDHRKYSSFERLALQREKILETLDYCRSSGIKKLEIIHGIGDGTLQNMVREVLRDKGLEFYDNALFEHQSGSVTVFLK